jgi:hypothetical protein
MAKMHVDVKIFDLNDPTRKFSSSNFVKRTVKKREPYSQLWLKSTVVHKWRQSLKGEFVLT